MMASPFASPVLEQAHAIQQEARNLLGLRQDGKDSTPAAEHRLSAWMEERRRLASAPLASPIDALAVAHTLLQAVEVIPQIAATDEDGTVLAHLMTELLAGSRSLIAYLEAEAKVSRSDLGLHDNYLGPTRN